MTSVKSPMNDAARKPKRDQLIALLRRKKPPTVDDLSTKLGWQCHTTRAAISRLRAEGLEVETIKGPMGTPPCYRLIVVPTASDAKAQAPDQ